MRPLSVKIDNIQQRVRGRIIKLFVSVFKCLYVTCRTVRSVCYVCIVVYFIKTEQINT